MLSIGNYCLKMPELWILLTMIHKNLPYWSSFCLNSYNKMKQHSICFCWQLTCNRVSWTNVELSTIWKTKTHQMVYGLQLKFWFITFIGIVASCLHCYSKEKFVRLEQGTTNFPARGLTDALGFISQNIPLSPTQL